ncbi:hypothetical protein XSR1_370037 [Xenorhabdus szentirmaii DSM 16338]|uniref:Uncharacterized protein n=1 Tax=Xenorhabdus szentirmaii DSM 16338 TaxID=1427518 RepID=W1IZA6_9GAMM|nr:hypothetical protein XSR1_370037 [Xenorhabdus szentirmaii DSM 16338]
MWMMVFFGREIHRRIESGANVLELEQSYTAGRGNWQPERLFHRKTGCYGRCG